MAKEYFEKLAKLVEALDKDGELTGTMQVKHFFSGAALYVNEKICVSLSPVGLAFKLPKEEVDELINSGRAIPLKYFPKGPEKRGYALFEEPDLTDTQLWEKYFKRAVQHVDG
jgi:hypothetical protein